MVYEILMLDTTNPANSNSIPSFISSSTSFNKSNTFFQSFNTIESLCVYLFTFQKQIISSNPDSKEVEKSDNVNEDEIYYPVGIIINSENSYTPSKSDLQSLSLDLQKRLFESRFNHLNTNVLVLPFSSTTSLPDTFASSLSAAYQCTKDRLSRVQTWVDLNPELAKAKSENPELRVNTMFNVLDDFNSVFNLDEEGEIINAITTSINYSGLLYIPHDDDYYLSKVHSWAFPAFDFTSDELLHIGSLILSRAISDFSKTLKEDELPSGIDSTSNELYSFLFYVRDNYRIGNPFHNFRHAIDVLQATTYFVSKLEEDKSFPIQLRKSEVFALLFASLGHDLGHPGITNVFLNSNNTLSSSMFNQTSVLEQFHFKQFSKIVQPYISLALEKANLIGNCMHLTYKAILATDMARHDSFVNEIDKFLSEYDSEDAKVIMLCCLLIKCADISNVCRPLEISVKWGLSLGEEFKEVAMLENKLAQNASTQQTAEFEVNPTCPPKLVKKITVEKALEMVPSLASSQMFFINRFALEFFSKISRNLKALDFLKNVLVSNAKYWEALIETKK